MKHGPTVLVRVCAVRARIDDRAVRIADSGGALLVYFFIHHRVRIHSLFCYLLGRTAEGTRRLADGAVLLPQTVIPTRTWPHESRFRRMLCAKHTEHALLKNYSCPSHLISESSRRGYCPLPFVLSYTVHQSRTRHSSLLSYTRPPSRASHSSPERVVLVSSRICFPATRTLTDVPSSIARVL